MVDDTEFYKRLNEKRLVLVQACEEFQRAVSRRMFGLQTSLTHEERPALAALQEALKEFNVARTGREDG